MMRTYSKRVFAVAAAWSRVPRSVDGAQLLEFALAMPMLLVMVVGIYDFGSAFNIKQKINNAAREGVRFAIDLSCADCTQNAPVTTQSIENSMVSYLNSAGVDVCGLTGTTSPTAGPLAYASWTFTSPSNCGTTGAPFRIEIDRGITFVNSTGTTVVASKVVVNSPFAWTFSRVIRLLLSGATSAGVSTISSDATMQNLP